MKRHWPIVVLFILELLLFATNYAPGTFVVGWDNMYPELNFGLNFKRAFFGVWQEYRGLGLEDGLSHAAQLPHYLFLWFSSFVLPQNLLRYTFIFLMHLLGGLGIYRLLTSLRTTKSVALIGALFYQYNFATIQMFYLPFEVFMVHFAFLPWLLWAALSYLSHGTRKYALVLAILSFISTPQAHVPTVFLVYFIALGMVILTHLLTHRTKAAWRRAGVIIAITFLVNAFWGLPFAHNTLLHAGEIANSKNNQMATDDIFAKNQRYGDLTSTALMRSFSLDYAQYDHTTGTQSFTFAPWKGHINAPIPAIAAGVFFGLAGIGAFLVVYERKKEWYPFVVLFAFSFLIIGNDVPVLSRFSETLRATIPLFHNVFRFVFTKFFTLYSLSYSVLIAVAILEIVRAFHGKKRDIFILVSLFVVLLAAYSWPPFQGNFFYKNLRVAIPKEYFDTFTFFSKQDPSKRIAVLPAPWFWAWTQYRWGVIGSGFQWFGIPQPLVDRAFDPWSQTNENFYWQISQAIYTKNPTSLLAVLRQHDISWILFDENIINATYDRAQYTDDIRVMLTSNLTKAFESGNITLYQLPATPTASFVSLANNVPNVQPAYLWNDNDVAFASFSSYVTDETHSADIWYPFRSLFSGRFKKDKAFSVDEGDKSLMFTGPAPQTPTEYTLDIPNIAKDEFVEIDTTTGLPKQASAPAVTVTDGAVITRIPKTRGALVYDSHETNDLEQPARGCNGYTIGTRKHETKADAADIFLRLTSIDSSNCVTFDLPTLPQRYGYVVGIEYRLVEGRPLSLSITNKETRRSFIETLLEPQTRDSTFITSWFVVPPMDSYGLGYSLTIDNIAIGRKLTVNDLKRVRAYPIPYDFLTNMKFVRGTPPQASFLPDNLSVSHPNPALYKVSIQNQDRSPTESGMTKTLMLSQSFDSGWVAVSGGKILPHVLVNNWANGWTLNPNTNGTIYLFFWPQLLEFLGFALIPLPFVFLLGRRKN